MQAPLRPHALLTHSARLPTTPATPTITLNPITLSVPSRPVPLQLRLTLPATTPKTLPSATSTTLPIILLSHGHGKSNHLSSLQGYSPLSTHFASHGFAVLQPTHLSSRTLDLSPTTRGAPLFWRERVHDMVTILDRLDEIEAAVPFAIPRLDAERVAVVGHSLGGHTACALLGMEFEDPDAEESGEIISLRDQRVKAGILLAVPGEGDEALSENGRAMLPFHRRVDFAPMAAPALVVVGDGDASAHLTTKGWEWHADAYRLGGGRKSLLTLFGGDHCLGGVSGYDVAETEREDLDSVAAVQRLSCAYLRNVLDGEEEAWEEAVGVLHDIGEVGRVESK